MDIMDTSYIKLCAEIAYNEVIFEACLEGLSEQTVITESFKDFVNNAKEKIIEIGKAIIDAIKNLATKVLNAIKDFFDKIKNSKAKKDLDEKIKELKGKIKSKKQEPQNASFSFVDQLMEMVLTEDESNYDIINFEKVFDHMRSVTDQLLKEGYACSSIMQQNAKKQVEDGLKFALETTKSIVKEVDEESAEETVNSLNDQVKDVLSSIEIECDEVLKTYVSKFKFKYQNPVTMNDVPSAITAEYASAKEDKENIISFDVEDTSLMLDYAQSLYIDAFANAIKDQFDNMQKICNNEIKEAENIIKYAEQQINSFKFTNIERVNNAVINLLTQSLTVGQKVSIRTLAQLSKASVAASSTFAKLASDSINQANKLVNKLYSEFGLGAE